ncbi:Uncharacterized protein C18B11.03c [Candida viswanathii]|uniref:Uncharacterized protein C18B11.03c n=1 Tax=Candida viswanathii TaxID=5486 RepID=A0A367XV44_9ASCO|nr:Uncharacterized protein C18B11.03c [Candida viswanathii]
MVQPQHTRKPEFNERLYICRTVEKYSSNFSISVKYAKPVSRALLSNALHSLIQKNSWFAQNFFRVGDAEKDDAVANGTNYEVRIVDSIRFDDVVTYEKIDKFGGETMGFLNDFLFTMNVSTLPLWKVFVFEESDGEQLISVCYDHAHFDGLSGVQFQKDLAKELSFAKEEYIEVLFEYKRDLQNLPAEIMPPADTLTDLFTPSSWLVANAICTKFVPLYATVMNYFWPPGPPTFKTDKPLEKNLKGHYRFLKLSPDKVAEISKYCRSIGVTLTAYIDIICLKSLQETVFQNVKSSAEHTCSLIAVNGRRYYSKDIQNFAYGTMVCGVPIIFPQVIDDERQAMKTFNKALAEDIKTKKSFQMIGLIKFANIWQYFKDKIVNNETRFTVTLSNLGKIADSNDVYTFKELYFTLSLGVIYNFVLNTTTLPNGELTAVMGNIPEFEKYKHNGTPIMDSFMSTFHHHLVHPPPLLPPPDYPPAPL